MYTAIRIINIFCLIVLLASGVYFIYQVISILADNVGRVRYTSTYFVKGICYLVLSVLPLFALIFFKRNCPLHNLFTLTLINSVITGWIIISNYF